MPALEEQRDLKVEPAVFTELGHAVRDAEFKKRSAFVILVAVGAIGALVAIWEARVILLVLFAGCLGALVLATLTSLVQRGLRIPRVFAFAVLLTALAVAVAIGVWLRGPALAEQLGKLQTDLPEAAKRLYLSLGDSNWGKWILANIPDDYQWSSWWPYAASGIRGAVSVIVSTLACFLLVTMASLYLAAEPQFYLRGMQRVLPSSIWATLEACLDGAVRMLRFWLISRVISMTTIGIMVATGLWLLSVPLAGTLGVVAALLTFVPNIGPILSALPAALLAFAVSPVKGMLTLAVFCVAHFIEGNVVTPIADRQVVKLPPFLTFSFQLLLAPITGALGVALAAPLLAAILGVVQVLPPSSSLSQLSIKSGQRI